MIWSDKTLQEIMAEAKAATIHEAREYVSGASRDGTFNRLHSTLRISQADPRWLEVLGLLFTKLGSRSWIYREGKRNVWVIETTYRLHQSEKFRGKFERAAFARGYFDAEGGIPRNPCDRFYLQFVQKDQADLKGLRSDLLHVGIRCGSLHNPSSRIDPDYWRFYVLAKSHQEFLRRVGSWHPRKRRLLESRSGGTYQSNTR